MNDKNEPVLLPPGTGSAIEQPIAVSVYDAIGAEHAHLKAACELLGLGYFTWDMNSGEQFWSEQSYRVLGFPQNITPTRKLFLSRVHPEDREYVLRATEQGLASQQAFYYEFRIVLDDHSVRYIQSRFGAASPSSGTVFGTNMDVTEARMAQQALELSEERLTEACHLLHLGYFSWDLVTNSQLWSDETYEILGIPVGTPVARDTFEKAVHPDDRERVFELTRKGIETGESTAIEYRVVRQDGEIRHVRSFLSIKCDRNGMAVSVLGSNLDITDAKHTEAAITYQAQHDRLTGLANRLLLDERLSQALARGGRHGYGFALLAVDLDHFKPINDQYGHPAGDLVLQEAARRMCAQTRINDLVARVGGDEFIILLDGKISEEDIRTAANKIISALSEPMTFTDFQCQIGASIGGALYPKNGTDAEGLLTAADQALYRAKEAGRNNAQFADEV